MPSEKAGLISQGRAMPDFKSFLVLSDIHFAGSAEKERSNFELQSIDNPALRLLVRFYRRYFWLKDPFAHNHLLQRVLDYPENPDFVVANGDYSCDSAFIGVSDPAAFASAHQCLLNLRNRFHSHFHAVLGDHELGKVSLFGGKGGMRIASWHAASRGLGLQPFWKLQIGNYVWLGIASSLVALPVFEPEILPEEKAEWLDLRQEHMANIQETFKSLESHQRLFLFCHDPTALPFLWEQEDIRVRLHQIDRTFIGHLHTNLILWKSTLLAGMPPIRMLGNSVRRMSTALHKAKYWRDFNVLLCPALAGIELLNDGGFCTGSFDIEGKQPTRFQFHPLPR
jgi:hypothetical protein